MPSALDETGLGGLRIESGASGFMSNMSIWLGPPHWKRKTTCLSRGFGPFFAAAAWSSLGIVRPSRPAPPTLRAQRRLSRVASNARIRELVVRLFMAGRLAKLKGQSLKLWGFIVAVQIPSR